MQISIWEKESFYADRDVIIIGAGLTGLWSAYELQQKMPAANILILEQGLIPTGASTRNAGFACFGSPTELLHDAAIMGADKMWQMAETRFKGIKKIRQLFGDTVINYDACGGYECLHQPLHNIEEVQEKLQWLNKGLKEITSAEQTFTRADEKLAAFGLKGFEAMIENKQEGGLHSGKLVQALTKKVQSMGVEILTGISVTKYEEDGKGINVYTKQGIHFKTKRMLVCSNAFTDKLVPAMVLKPGRGQIIVTTPINGLALKGTFHYDEGYYYFRNAGNRILLGGARNKCFEEETTTMFATTEIIEKELENFLTAHFVIDKPFTIEYKWSGIMCFTENKEPCLQNITPNIIAVIACNGMGVALSPIITENLEF